MKQTVRNFFEMLLKSILYRNTEKEVEKIYIRGVMNKWEIIMIKKCTGGRTTSKIENQDSVAAIYALEQLHSTDIFGFCTKIVDFCIKCEGEEDIEIFNKEKHILFS